MLKVYNSLSRQLEDFKPLKGKTVTMYSCGPTVYDYAHIGNLRTFLFADTLRRWLEQEGYKVKQVMNITDVGHMLGDADVGEDKMDIAAKRENIDPLSVARKYEAQFMIDIGRLNLEPAFKYPRASDHVKEMIKIIAQLIKNGYAYVSGEDVYFDVAKFPAYGQLSGNTVAALVAGHRVEINPKKRHPADFALWINNPKHLLQWDAPWSRGYPGWHIECSAMATTYLGDTIDIHTGGEDHKFPHHECEIAQTEGFTGKRAANYWMHASFLLVDGQRMGKSLNNFYRLDDIIAKGYEPRVLRYSLISSHYREQQNFTFPSLDAAKSAVGKLDAIWSRLLGQNSSDKNDEGDDSAYLDGARDGIVEAMDDDLNVPKALGVLFDFVRELNAAMDAGPIDPRPVKKFLEDFVSGVLGIKLKNTTAEIIPTDVAELLKEREAARQNKDYKKADELRGKIKTLGFEVVDSLVVDDKDGGIRIRKI